MTIADTDCGLARGCAGISSLFDRVGSLFGRILEDGAPESLVTTKSIPVAASREPKPVRRRPPGAQTARVPPPPPRLRKTKPAAAPMTVDSLNIEDQYRILEWNLIAYRSGSVDSVRTDRGAAPSDGGLALAKGGFVVLSGWAGHPAYGMRFRDVLFSLCGKVVGRAAVKGARPDVAAAVHMNLARSGWSAKLAADLMPRCEEQMLQAWGVAPIGHNIFSLTGKTAISFAESAGSPDLRYRPKAGPLTPAQNGPAELKTISVNASALRLRKCGDAKCDVVGRLAGGSHEGYVLETVGDWTLFQVGQSVGWANNRYLSVR